jgi:hypothetical protein
MTLPKFIHCSRIEFTEPYSSTSSLLKVLAAVKKSDLPLYLRMHGAVLSGLCKVPHGVRWGAARSNR